MKNRFKNEAKEIKTMPSTIPTNASTMLPEECESPDLRQRGLPALESMKISFEQGRDLGRDFVLSLT